MTQTARADRGGASASREARSPRVLLVHGGFFGAWCWTDLIASLARRNIPAEAVDLPFTCFADDVAAVAAAIDQSGADGSPVVAIAHSLGGVHLSEAAAPGVCRRPPAELIYLTAAMVDPRHPPASDAFNVSGVLRYDGDTVRADPVGAVSRFFNRCQPHHVELAARQLRPMPIASLIPPPLNTPAWRYIPSTFIVCTDDRVIGIETQRTMASNADASREIDADHSPFFSRTEELAELIAEIGPQSAVNSAPRHDG